MEVSRALVWVCMTCEHPYPHEPVRTSHLCRRRLNSARPEKHIDQATAEGLLPSPPFSFDGDVRMSTHDVSGTSLAVGRPARLPHIPGGPVESNTHDFLEGDGHTAWKSSSGSSSCLVSPRHVPASPVGNREMRFCPFCDDLSCCELKEMLLPATALSLDTERGHTDVLICASCGGSCSYELQPAARYCECRLPSVQTVPQVPEEVRSAFPVGSSRSPGRSSAVYPSWTANPLMRLCVILELAVQFLVHHFSPLTPRLSSMRVACDPAADMGDGSELRYSLLHKPAGATPLPCEDGSSGTMGLSSADIESVPGFLHGSTTSAN